MVARITTFAFDGVEAQPVDVQVQLSGGQVAFMIVGLPDKAVGESRERVRATFAALGLALPPKRVIVNLAPADLPKEGSHYDLAIALAMLAKLGVIPEDQLAKYAAIGELSLDGRLVETAGVLPAAMAAESMGLSLICPQACGAEAAWAGGGVLPAPSLIALINHFAGRSVLGPPKKGDLLEAPIGPDLREVKGQEGAKRALEIAAAAGITPSIAARRAREIRCSPSGCQVCCRRYRRANCLKSRRYNRSPACFSAVSFRAPAHSARRTIPPRWPRLSAAASRRSPVKSRLPIAASFFLMSCRNSQARCSIVFVSHWRQVRP